MNETSVWKKATLILIGLILIFSVYSYLNVEKEKSLVRESQAYQKGLQDGAMYMLDYAVAQTKDCNAFVFSHQNQTKGFVGIQCLNSNNVNK